jgi:hypothetical protein
LTYIGQQPSTTFDSGIQDRFTGLTTNTVTLTHDISAETDILVVWNNIVQDSGSYSVGGAGNKTLTLGGTLSSGDVVTVYYTNKVMQSVSPTAGSVQTLSINDGAVTDAKIADVAATKLTGTIATARLGSGTASSSNFLRGDGSWQSAGGANTPAFEAYKNVTANVSNETYEKIGFDTEVFDVGGCYDTTNRRFLPTTAGKYFVYLTVWMSTESNGNFEVMWADIYKNGSSTASQSISAYSSNALRDCSLAVCSTVVMNGSSDYVEGWSKILDNAMSSNPRLVGGATASKFGAFRIIE